MIILKKLLEIENLNIGFDSKNGFVPVVKDVSFSIKEGESVALVGESGSGKSVTALSILRLLKIPPAQIEAEHISMENVNLLDLSEKEMREIRGNMISMIFQEPMTSLNPLLPVGYQVAETVRKHLGYSKEEAYSYAAEMLRKVGISDPNRRLGEYPFQLSGGMNQRIMIAIALACEPKLLIADEPTTALDVTIQAQILDLIKDLQQQNNMAMLLITHNMGIVAEVAEKVMVMYAGEIIEYCDVETVFTHPYHPYTHGLLTSIPSAHEKVSELNVIKGSVPNPMFFPKGCRFSPRCPFATEKCFKEAPTFEEIKKGHWVRCHYPLVDSRGVVDDKTTTKP